MPWFSPPAIQYVARFTGNPPRPRPHYMNPPGLGQSMLSYSDYQGPPGFGRGVYHNPPFRLGDKVTWSEEALDLEIGRPGTIMRVLGPSFHPNDTDRTRVEFVSGHQRMVNNWELAPAIRSNPWFSPAAIQYVARFTNPPAPLLSHWCPECGLRVCEPGDLHTCGSLTCPRGGSESSGWRPGCGADLPRGHEPEDNPPGPYRNPRHDVLCQCGWGRLNMPEDEIPAHCPVCNARLQQGGHSEDYWSGVAAEQDDYDDPSWGAAYGDEGSFNNPPNGLMIRGREVPVEHSAKGKYHHVRVADPREFKSIRTKTLSAKKGIKARVGILVERGPRGGKTEIQSYLFDAKKYTPQDVARWIEAHRTPAPILVEVSQAATQTRRLIRGKAKEAPTKLRKKVKAKKKRRPRKVPTDAKRCTAKGKNGRCKGYKQAGKKQCALHAAGVAGKRQPKKRKKRKVG